MDKISLDRIQLAHPKVRAELTAILEQAEKALTGEWKPRLTWTLRTFQEQNDLFAQGRTRPGRVVTWARGGDSWHNYGLAVDICLVHISGKMVSFDSVADFDKDGVADWIEVVKIFKSFGWEWGGDWAKPKTDLPHFQKTFGLSIAQAKAKITPKQDYISI
ncbi:M15 family metallopeptidase [Runella limosa]|uniref:M15 family metallopeptidase n=1 Tax=Runella limosa TaxID=370978 RepID=UPI00040A19A9|nr:M15 family metallopeptidase [Runella limosa]